MNKAGTLKKLSKIGTWWKTDQERKRITEKVQ